MLRGGRHNVFPSPVQKRCSGTESGRSLDLIAGDSDVCIGRMENWRLQRRDRDYCRSTDSAVIADKRTSGSAIGLISRTDRMPTSKSGKAGHHLDRHNLLSI